jgi:hypothetical protein
MPAEKMGLLGPCLLSGDVLLVQYGSLTGAELQSSSSSSLMVSKITDCVAETVGFEPTIESPLYTLSRRAPSTTRPRLRDAFQQRFPLGVKLRFRKGGLHGMHAA